MPFPFERRGQFVDGFVEEPHYIIVRALKRDFSGPHRSLRLNLHAWISCDHPGSADPSKTFLHAFDNPLPIVAPLVLKFVTNKIGHSVPASVFDPAKEILCVSLHLTLTPP